MLEQLEDLMYRLMRLVAGCWVTGGKGFFNVYSGDMLVSFL